MLRRSFPVVGCVVAVGIALAITFPVFGNGGPFVIKYPDGDPAARGIIARVDPDLKPARETRLRVIHEDLKIRFTKQWAPSGHKRKAEPPLVNVSARYVIENPTDERIAVDFGFPILRGIYMSPYSMMPRADVLVRIDDRHSHYPEIVSNSAIYGLIRQRAREVIEKGIAADSELARQVARVRSVAYLRSHAAHAIEGAIVGDEALREAARTDPLLADLLTARPETQRMDYEAARDSLRAYLTESTDWSVSDVALMVEFASIDLGGMKSMPRDRGFFTHWGAEGGNANLGALSAIGEQKATQLFATLATLFKPEAGTQYEEIFTAWGGDVREQSVDLKTGEVRPREITVTFSTDRSDGPVATPDVREHGPGVAVQPEGATPGGIPVLPDPMSPEFDPTIYARVDYLDEGGLTEAEKASCQTILKHLPVIFTFAPMNLLHYEVEFEPHKTRTVEVTYSQYAYRDTRDPATYQVAYVVHPASMWDDFGPINLEVAAPAGIELRASVDLDGERTEEQSLNSGPSHAPVHPDHQEKTTFAIRSATLARKTGELFVAIDAAAWDRKMEGSPAQGEAGKQARR